MCGFSTPNIFPIVCSWVARNLIQIRGSHNSFLWFGNLLGLLTELKVTLYLWLSVYYEGYKSGTAKWKRSIEQGMVKKQGASMPSPGAPPP